MGLALYTAGMGIVARLPLHSHSSVHTQQCSCCVELLQMWGLVQVLRFEDQPSACLGVTFAPWDPQLLIFAEVVHRIYVTGSVTTYQVA